MQRLHLAMLLIAAAFACTATAAADDASCDGHWQGHFINPLNRKEETADLTITGSTGFWITQLRVGQTSKGAACRAIRYPVRVHQCTASALDLFVDGSKVLRGCPKFPVRLIRHGDDSAQGVKGGHHETLEMTRQR